MTNTPPGTRSDQPRSFPPSGLKRGFEALGVRNYRLYWWGQVLSLIGTWMQQVSLPWLVLALGGSPIELAIVGVLEFGPAGVLAPFGGVFADRIDKRRALMMTQAAAAAQSLILVLLTFTGVVSIPLVMVMAFVLGIVNAVDMPVRQSLAPDLVPRNILANAIALNSMAFNTARVVGPAVAGVIIATATHITGSVLTGIAVNLGINSISYAAVLTGLFLMDPGRIRRHEQPERHPPVLDSLREGFSYAVRTPLVLWCLVLLGGIAAFGFNFQILLPLFAQNVLGLGADGYGGLYAVMGAGSLAGAFTLAYMRQRPAIFLMLGGGAVFGVLLVGIALSRSAWVAAPFVLLAGYSSMLMINTINATVQANVTDALRGRVMSFYVTVFAGSAPLGSLFAGIVAELFGTPIAFLAGAVLSVATVGIVALGLRGAASRGSLGVTRLDTATTGSRA